MGSKIRRLGIVIALSLVLMLGIVVLTASYSESGVTCEVGAEGSIASLADFSAVPQSVVDDATELATELFGDGQEKCDDFVNQLLSIYLEAGDKDFVIFFNPGGWGWNLVEASPGWRSIFTGIKSELDSSGYTALMLNHVRAVDSFLGRLDEAGEMITGYQLKAKDLACRAEFLTTHIPDLKVILAGESTGTIITDSAMKILADNPRVYSIQTGPPFWHQNTMLDRTLVLADNGITPDSLSQGDYPGITWGYFKDWFNLSESEDYFGTAPHYIAAPGHDYWWQYPEVYSQITNFLKQNFAIK
ncbi:MAG: hypothetical protein OEZ00_05305 [Dehalococcoidia bacterium]|nr:hypothetical protein [Dehalococcoidia bacterium]